MEILIAKYRKLAGMTQDEAAKSLGVPLRTYASWERGEREPSLISACAICDIFGCTLDQLVGRPSIESEIVFNFNRLDDAHQEIVRRIIDADAR